MTTRCCVARDAPMYSSRSSRSGSSRGTSSSTMTGRSRPLNRRIDSHRTTSFGGSGTSSAASPSEPPVVADRAVPQDLVAVAALLPDGRMLEADPAQHGDRAGRDALGLDQPVEHLAQRLDGLGVDVGGDELDRRGRRWRRAMDARPPRASGSISVVDRLGVAAVEVERVFGQAQLPDLVGTEDRLRRIVEDVEDVLASRRRAAPRATPASRRRSPAPSSTTIAW